MILHVLNSRQKPKIQYLLYTINWKKTLLHNKNTKHNILNVQVGPGKKAKVLGTMCCSLNFIAHLVKFRKMGGGTLLKNPVH